MPKWLLGLTLTALLAGGCAAQTPCPPPTAGAGTLATPTLDIAKGVDSRIDRSRRVVIRDAASWQALWREHAGLDTSPPDVDFANEMVVGAFAGERLTAGYAITIQSVQPCGKRVQVTVREAAPGTSEVTAQVLTRPFHLVRTPRLEGEVFFIEAPSTP
jgi:hypothetical protein